jgi:hypothetical protein
MRKASINQQSTFLVKVLPSLKMAVFWCCFGMHPAILENVTAERANHNQEPKREPT